MKKGLLQEHNGIKWTSYNVPNADGTDTCMNSSIDAETEDILGWSSEYYELPVGATELQDLIEFKNMNFALGNIFKACYRMGDKAGTSASYDLNKIVFYAQRELRRIENEDRPGNSTS